MNTSSMASFAFVNIFVLECKKNGFGSCRTDTLQSLTRNSNYGCMTERGPELDYRYKSSQSFRGTFDNSDVYADAAKGTNTG